MGGELDIDKGEGERRGEDENERGDPQSTHNHMIRHTD